MTTITAKAYLITLRKYMLTDIGVLVLLIALPFLVNPDSGYSIIFKAIFLSTVITPAICFYEIKRSNQLPFYDNLNISLFLFYGCVGLLKIIIAFTFKTL